MTTYKFPPIYRAVGFTVGGKPYLLYPANNTVVGPQVMPLSDAAQKALIAICARLDAAKLHNQIKNSFTALFS